MRTTQSIPQRVADIRQLIHDEGLGAMMASLITEDGHINLAEDASIVNWIKTNGTTSLPTMPSCPVVTEFDDGGHFRVLTERFFHVTDVLVVYAVYLEGDTGHTWSTLLVVDFTVPDAPVARRPWYMNCNGIQEIVDPVWLVSPVHN